MTSVEIFANCTKWFLGEREPLLKGATDEETLITSEDKDPPPPPPSYSEVLNPQAVLNLLVYTLLALHNMGFDQLLPVFLRYAPLGSHTDATAISILARSNPLKGAGGFGLDHFRIGLITTVRFF